jgi:streptogramin lyase
VPQSNDLFVDEHGLIWVTDRGTGGVFCLEPLPELANLMTQAAS